MTPTQQAQALEHIRAPVDAISDRGSVDLTSHCAAYRDAQDFLASLESEKVEAPSAAPAVESTEDERKWLIYYHDKDHHPDLFCRGGNSEACAREFHRQQLSAWNCHLFMEIFPGEQMVPKTAYDALTAKIKADAELMRRAAEWIEAASECAKVSDENGDIDADALSAQLRTASTENPHD